MFDNYLSVIAADWLDFLENDSRFSGLKYHYGIEVGIDRDDYKKQNNNETIDHGFNMFTLNYTKEDSQAREINEIGLEYFETYNLDPENDQFPAKIKERAKWFVNWIDSGYSKTYTVNVGGSCYETIIENIKIKEHLGFVNDIDNSAIIKYNCIFNVYKRNNYKIQLKEDYPNITF